MFVCIHVLVLLTFQTFNSFLWNNNTCVLSFSKTWKVYIHARHMIVQIYLATELSHFAFAKAWLRQWIRPMHTIKVFDVSWLIVSWPTQQITNDYFSAEQADNLGKRIISEMNVSLCWPKCFEIPWLCILQYFWPSLSYHLSLRSWSIFEWPLKTGFTVNDDDRWRHRPKLNSCGISSGSSLFGKVPV